LHLFSSLLAWYAPGVKNSANKVFLVHGETCRALPLKEKIDAQGLKNVFYP
jgi:hypothetical protein